MHNQTKLLLGMIFMLLGSFVFAQSNDFIDSVIADEGITISQAAYLVMVASDNLGDDVDAARAFDLLKQLSWVPEGMKPDDTVTYAQFSYILMKAFSIKSGFMFELFPSPRYAYRELIHQVVIQGATDPDLVVSGTGAMHMLSRIFDVKGIK